MELITWIFTLLIGAFVIMSGVFKLSGSKKIKEGLTQSGYGNFIPVLGIAEIIFALLFIYPATRNIGFLLLICYFSGALATDISHRHNTVPPVVFLILLFVAEYLFNPALFF